MVSNVDRPIGGCKGNKKLFYTKVRRKRRNGVDSFGMGNAGAEEICNEVALLELWTKYF